MRRREDDLTAWQDDPVVSALTAPATPQELAGAEPALAAYRAAARARRGPGRFAGRLGAGVTTLVVGVALSGGVAAAYTRSLPDTLQAAAHSLLGPVGVPAPEPQPPSARGPGAGRHHHGHAGAPVAAAGATAAPVGDRPASAPAAGGAQPGSRATLGSAAHPAPSATPAPAAAVTSAASGPATASPAAPTPTPVTPSATASPTPTASAAAPSTLTAAAGRLRAPVHHWVAVRGTVTDTSGAPVAGVRVLLQQRPGTGGAWERVAAGRTDSAGSVRLATPPLEQTVAVRLVTRAGLRSPVVRIVEVPSLAVSMRRAAGGKRYVVTVTADGAAAGDAAVLDRGADGTWRRVTRTNLDGAGQVTVRVAVPASHPVAYRLRLPATATHGFTAVRFTAVPAGT